MKRSLNLTAIIVFAILFSGAAHAGEPVSVSLHLRLLDIMEPMAPELFEGDTLIFSAPGNFRSVSVAFAHENWSMLHPFKKTANGVYICTFSVPRQYVPRTASSREAALEKFRRTNTPVIISELEYRYVIDGVWTYDSVNPMRRVDPRTGVSLSVVPIPLITDETPDRYSLIEEGGRTARFLFRGIPGETIMVTGTFNGWDPYMYELEEVEPGVYAAGLSLPPGTYYYSFVYLGEKIPDPLNGSAAWTSQGVKVSVLKVK